VAESVKDSSTKDVISTHWSFRQHFYKALLDKALRKLV
jgi:hypothetical protein